ncbi:MAG: recombinase RarA, partial [Bacilli bacterium]
PKHIKNGNPDYKYPHDYPNNYVVQQYLPDNIKNKKYYQGKNTSKYEKSLIDINNKLEEIKKG